MNPSKYLPIVLCAGFGTRLRPLTHYLPKVACPFGDSSFAFSNIEIFLKAGFEKVYCNVHYLAEIVVEEIRATALAKGYDPKRVVFFHESSILETGGGIVRIVKDLIAQDASHSQKDIIVVSGDIVSDFPLEAMCQAWESRQAGTMALLSTLPLSEDRKDVTWVSDCGKWVLGFGQDPLFESKQPRLFSNHQIIQSNVVSKCHVEKQSSINLFYRQILKDGHQILHMDYSNVESWFNVGDLKEYSKCLEKYSEQKNMKYDQFGNILLCLKTAPSLLVHKLENWLKNGHGVSQVSHSIVLDLPLQTEQVSSSLYIPLKALLSERDPVSKDMELFYFRFSDRSSNT